MAGLAGHDGPVKAGKAEGPKRTLENGRRERESGGEKRSVCLRAGRSELSKPPARPMRVVRATSSEGRAASPNSLAAEAGEEGEDVFPGLEGVGAEMDKRTHKVLGAI